MLKFYSFSIVILLLYSPFSYAESEVYFSAETYLRQGDPSRAISTAQKLVADPALTNVERKELLGLIADAEMFITKARAYNDVSLAVEAIRTLIKEFPSKVDEPFHILNIVELYWNQGETEKAQTEIFDLQGRYPNTPQAQKSWLILGKIHFIGQRYSAARSAFLRFALNVKRESHDGLEVRLWTALVDYEEHRFNQAAKELSFIFATAPSLITDKESIYTRYITLLDTQNQKAEALKHANIFLKMNKETMHASAVRLLRADLMLELPNPDINTIIQEYSLIADKESGTKIGRQAFIRKMMVQMRDKKTYRDLKPVIIALKRIANQNQMSAIEDESFLHEGILWEKTSIFDPTHSPKGAGEAALQQFSRASSAIYPRIASQAKANGLSSFKRQINALIKQKEWLSAISLWEKFPNFRPPLQNSAQLRFDVARGLRLLMEYEQSENILSQLHEQAKDNVWGEKIMLERARLWLDRQDPQGVQKILEWLDKNEYTLYRPEMLVIVAHMQIKAKDATGAAHTLGFILPEDLSHDTKAEYWKVQALTTEKQSRWHVSAKAWREYAKQNITDVEQAHINEADALFKGKDFILAERLYEKTPETLQTPAWQYRYSICQLKSGKWNQALERLALLKANTDAGIYQSLASLTLAEREAERLIRENP
ncbi:MAG: tetratricopeptide repeat protein [Ghiorsea sp.]